MKIRIIEGAGSPWEGEAQADGNGSVIQGEGYCTLDDLTGIVVVTATAEEIKLLDDAGFELPWLA